MRNMLSEMLCKPANGKLNPQFKNKLINFRGNEEREGKVPFEKGVGFDLVIINEQTHFEIKVNDQTFTLFAHRSDPSQIYGLQIQGDLEITGIQIRD
jgi:hypothetical protein